MKTPNTPIYCLPRTAAARLAAPSDAAPAAKAAMPSGRAWPATGYVWISDFIAASGLSRASVYEYIKHGLLPAPEPIGLGRVAWDVDTARAALAELPARSAALRAERAKARREEVRAAARCEAAS